MTIARKDETYDLCKVSEGRRTYTEIEMYGRKRTAAERQSDNAANCGKPRDMGYCYTGENEVPDRI